MKLSSDLDLPTSAVTQKFAFLGISGSGKTYGAGKFAELLLDAGAQVVVIDTVGNWYGLRLLADGKRPGFAIPILGGERGDVALEPHAGKLAAETVAETKASLILDVSDFSGGELRRFVEDFAVELLRLKKRAKSPVMIIWEECQDIVPQRVTGEVARMVGAVEKLIKKGRNYGVGNALISQRPAAVNKDVLTQIETLFAFRTIGAPDRKQISEWVVQHATEAVDLVDELPKLETGEAFCWSPRWLGVLKKIRVAKKRTFDASATPDFDEEVTAGALAPVDLEKFKRRMSDAIERAKGNDPAVLKARVAELERQLAAAAKVPTKVETKVVERAVVKDADVARLEKAIASTKVYVDLLKVESSRIADVASKLEAGLAAARAPSTVPIVGAIGARAPLPARKEPVAIATNRMVPVRDQVAMERARATGAGDLPRGEAATLRALIQYPNGLRREQLTILTGYKRSSRDSYLQRLRERGFVDVASDRVTATDAGRAAMPDAAPLPVGGELRDWWLARLPAGERAVLEVLIEKYPNAVPREEIDYATGYKRSSRDSYLQRLAGKELVVEAARGEVRAHAALFDEGGRR